MATRKRIEGKRKGRRERGERIMNKLDTQQACLLPENSVLLKEPQGHQIIFLALAQRLIRNYMLDMLTHLMSKGRYIVHCQKCHSVQGFIITLLH